MFKCIHCGASAKELICDGSTSLDTIELKICERCGKHLDKYLEYDVIIVILDMVLMKKEAYRHILFNTKFEKHWRMAVLLILVQGFFDWSTKCNVLDIHPSHIIFYNEKIYGSFLLQMAFFCFLSFIESAFFMIYITCIASIHCYLALFSPKPPLESTNCSFLLLWKGMVLGSFQQFFLVAPIIWYTLNSEPYILAIHLFQFFTITLVFSVLCCTPWTTSAVVVGSGAIGKVLLRHLIVIKLLKLNPIDAAEGLCVSLSL